MGGIIAAAGLLALGLFGLAEFRSSTTAVAQTESPAAGQAQPTGSSAGAAAEQETPRETTGPSGGGDLVATLRAALDEVGTLRAELAEAKRRNLKLEAGRAEDAITLSLLKTELDQTNAEMSRLREQLEASWRWIEELNTILAEVPAADGEAEQVASATVERSPGPGRADGDGAVGQEEAAAATATAAEQAPPATAPPTQDLADDERSGGDGASDAAATGGYHTATAPVNLRAGPENDAAVVTVVGEGHTVQVIGRQGGWLEVEYTDPLSRDFTGWVYERFLSPATPSGIRADAVALPRRGDGG